MAELLFTGNTQATTYPCHDFNEGMAWLSTLDIIGSDTETNVVKSILMRLLKVVSVADEAGTKVWVIEWEFLTDVQQRRLLREMKKKLNIYHNVAFDYQILKKNGIVLEKVYCTYIGEQTLTNGLAREKGFHGLQAIFKRRFDIDISKDEQLTFGEGKPFTTNQIQYAGVDVLKLGLLRKLQLAEMRAHDKRINQHGNKGMIKSNWWDNEFNKAVADMEMQGTLVDKPIWYGIEDDIKPTWDEELAALNKLSKELLWDTLEANSWVADYDRLTVNVWSSAKMKAEVLEHVYDFAIEKTAKAELKKYLQLHDPKFPEGLKLSGKAWNTSEYPRTLEDEFSILKLIILDSKTFNATEYLNKFLMANLKEFCLERKWIIPANEVSINWAAWPQRLKIFQAINPGIESTGKEILEDYITESPIIAHYLEWSSVNHTITSFGKAWYDKHVDLDGKFRTRFNIMLQTGRLSSTEPNLLNIPRKKFSGVFRKAIIPDPGKDMVDADYDGQELVITTGISKEPSWTEYLAKGYDLHSKNAELIFGEEWNKATEPGCAFYEGDDIIGYAYKKCKCKGHVEMRDDSKAVSFGSIYGITFMALSARLKITEERAKFILKRFFEIVPAVDAMMQRFGAYAIANGLIIEPVFGRVRFFDKWKLSVPSEHGKIRRAAFNTPIQSAGSAILKIAFVLLRRWINHNNLQQHVQLILPYHDESIVQCTPYYTESVKYAVTYYMELAAKLGGFDVGASAKSGSSWFDTH